MFGRSLLGLLGAALLASAATAQTVPTYHGAADRGGLYVTPGLTPAKAAGLHADTAFNATVSGAVYAQPLYWLPPGATTGRIIVATEDNAVYALDAATGAPVWQRTLGTPVTSSALPCGNINPIGVTGTPVIDPASGTLYADALIAGSGGPRHKIFALSLANGKILPGWPVGVDGGLKDLQKNFNSSSQGQRSALTIAGGDLFVTYGGNWGDCSIYHGTVVQLPLGTPKITAVWTTRAHGGGIWAQSGIASDGQSLFVATGNTMGVARWQDGEAVIRLRPGLARSGAKADFFTPANWHDLDTGDADLGGTGPIPFDLPAGNGATLPRLLQFGKDGNAYLLNRNNLGGIGGQIAAAHVSTSQIISAAARFPLPHAAMVAFQAPGAGCPAGQSGNLVMLRVTAAPSALISTAWCAAVNGDGAPIVTTTDGSADPIVWILGAQGDNQLHGFRGVDGTPVFSGGALGGLQRNATILAAEGRFYVAGVGRVYAFAW
jgi:outer membrane protein assembly factor BamB